MKRKLTPEQVRQEQETLLKAKTVPSKRREALDELVRISEELGLYEVTARWEDNPLIKDIDDESE